MIARLRLYSGLVLFAYVVGHLANHAFGLVSIEAMNAGMAVTIEPWRSWPGTVLLAGAALVHVGSPRCGRCSRARPCGCPPGSFGRPRLAC